jgi:hypothetical protein
MKPTSITTYVSLCALALTLGTAPSLHAENLLPEGSMEIAGKGGLPEGFEHPNNVWLKKFGGKVSAEQQEGNTFLRIDMPQAESLVRSAAEIKLPEGTSSVRVAWRVRADIKEVSANDDKSGRGVVMIFRFYSEGPSVPEGERGGKFVSIEQIQQSTDGWVDKEKVLAVPEGKKYLQIQFGTKGTAAVADFDDVVVEKAD